MTGFFQLDWGLYSQDAQNRATLGDIDDSLGFRRTRLAATGNVSEQTSYTLTRIPARAGPTGKFQ